MYALIDSHLHELINDQTIKHIDHIHLWKYVQPASIDLPVWEYMYHLNHPFVPYKQSIQEQVIRSASTKLTTQWWVTLYKWQTYLIPCLSVSIPSWLFGKISPKSSLGRIDVLIRALVDYTWIYDTIFPTTQGTVRLEVTPQSFNIQLHHWDALTQLMFFDTNNTSKIVHDQYETTFLREHWKKGKSHFYQNNLIVWVWVPRDTIVWYKARFTNKIINLQEIWTYESKDFFEPLYAHEQDNKQQLSLEKGRFYILPTKQQICVPKEFSLELLPFSHLMGELRVHYAWFFDPWFWWQQWSTWVLEVRPHQDTLITDWQPICLIEIYKNKAIPKQIYWQVSNNYQGQQWATLAKYFKYPH